MLSFGLFLCLLLRSLPESVNCWDKVFIIHKIWHHTFIILNDRILKVNKIIQTQTHISILIRITYKLLIIFRTGHNLQMPTTIQQIKELYGKLSEMVGSKWFDLLTCLWEGAHRFEEFEIVLWFGDFDCVDIFWESEGLLNEFSWWFFGWWTRRIVGLLLHYLKKYFLSYFYVYTNTLG